MKGHMKGLHMVTFLLLVFGGLNILSFTWIDWEIGELMGGPGAIATKVFYTLVGLSAIYQLATHKGDCAKCNEKSTPTAPTPPAQPDGIQS